MESWLHVTACLFVGIEELLWESLQPQPGIFKVLGWSFRMLFMGYVFDVLPNGEKWEQDAGRLAAGVKLAGHALVLQCRGDWPFLKLLMLVLQWVAFLVLLVQRGPLFRAVVFFAHQQCRGLAFLNSMRRGACAGSAKLPAMKMNLLLCYTQDLCFASCVFTRWLSVSDALFS